ncbi:MAG: Maf-like protein [Bacteroidia bacterium]
MYPESLSRFKYILASKSPRRQFLLSELGIPFELKTKDVDESFPSHLKAEEIPLFLCRKKAEAFHDELSNDSIIITADTIVWVNGHVLNKPADEAEARLMLRELSGNRHEVYTGVCLKSSDKEVAFTARTDVFFKELSEGEISYYIQHFQPFDKAGSYGAQEWIGYIAVERIEGSYFNVMGLPVKELYEELSNF